VRSTTAAQVLIANFGRPAGSVRGVRANTASDVFVIRASGLLPALLAG
jgi:hypothetical protein